jgi:glycerol-3-phosphate acyltransferase PlsY
MPSDFPLTIWLLTLLGAYLLGSVPFGLLISLAKGVDVRRFGSGNIGASNVGRTLGRPWGILTFALDALKGFAPVLAGGFVLGTIAQHNTSNLMAVAWLSVGVASFLGHLFPVWLGFKGGKGVATGFGALLGIFPILTIPAIMAIVVWALSVRVTRYIGLSSCIAAITLPVWTIFVPALGALVGFFRGAPSPSSIWPDWTMLWPFFSISAAMAIFVVVRHRSNFVRMLNGTETRVGQRAAPIAPRAPRAPSAPSGPGAASTSSPDALAMAPGPASSNVPRA